MQSPIFSSVQEQNLPLKTGRGYISSTIKHLGNCLSGKSKHSWPLQHIGHAAGFLTVQVSCPGLWSPPASPHSCPHHFEFFTCPKLPSAWNVLLPTLQAGSFSGSQPCFKVAASCLSEYPIVSIRYSGLSDVILIRLLNSREHRNISVCYHFAPRA